MKSMSPRAFGVLADTINDDASTRKVYLLAAGLAVLGIALVIVTVWFWRSTRPDPELLAPLEVMGAKRFKRLDGGEQREMLDRSRPVGAKTMRWGVQRGKASADPEVGVGANLRGSLAPYEELRDPALIASAHEDIPSGVDHVRGSEAGDLAGTSEAVIAAAQADAAAHAELDSILAAVGAVVPGRPVDPAITARPAGFLGSKTTPTEAAADAASASSDAPADESEGEPSDGEQGMVGQTAVEQPVPDEAVEEQPVPDEAMAESPVLGHSEVEAAENGRSEVSRRPAVDRASVPPLIIVPVDHDLRPSSSSTPDRRPSTSLAPDNVSAGDGDPGADDDGRDEQAADDEPESIDPLLRLLNRNDS